MSHINNNNFTTNGNQTFHNFFNQIPFKTTEGNDGRKQLFILIDFDYRHLLRALFNVPVKRSKGLATLSNGSVINEKQLQLYGNFLNLRERVEYRKRVIAFQNLLFFPKWDLDGPDIRYFGEYNPPTENIHSLTSFRAGPWVLDGRQMVADAKDIGIMLAETVVPSEKVYIAIYSPFTIDFQSQRGWNLGRGPFDAFWSGIRKAADQIHIISPYINFIAVSETNPYHEITKVCHVQWKTKEELKTFTDGNIYQAIPGDAFGITGFSEQEDEILTEQKIPKEFLFQLFFQNVQIQTSMWAPKFRNPVWNPRTRLALLHSRQQNKYPCQSQ